jgi:Uma2 family endonuclease
MEGIRIFAMATVTDPGMPDNLAEMLDRLGNVPLERIRMRPAPGTATEEDVIAALEAPDKRLYELIDGVLVEKAMGIEESLLAGILVHILWDYVEIRKLGYVFPADGAVRLFPKLVRIPDVSFIRRDRLPGGKMPRGKKLLYLAPDLAVEVLSESNRSEEMKRKLRDYFLAGISVVWFIQPKTQTAEIYTAPDKKKRIGKDQALEAKGILPGFVLPLKELFERAE